MISHEITTHDLPISPQITQTTSKRISDISKKPVLCPFCHEYTGSGKNSRRDHIGRHMEEVAFAVVSTPYAEWDFYSASTLSSLQTTSRFPSAFSNDFPLQSLDLSKSEDKRLTSTESNPRIVDLKGIENEPVERLRSVESQSRGDLDSQRVSECRYLDPSTGRNCNIVYSRQKDFNRHIATVHFAAKDKLRCSFCSTKEIFPRKSGLTRHMKSKHPGIPWSIRPSQCPVCGIDNEQFKVNTRLNIHMADSHPDVTWPHPTPLRHT